MRICAHSSGLLSWENEGKRQRDVQVERNIGVCKGRRTERTQVKVRFGKRDDVPARNWLAWKSVPWDGFWPKRTICWSETGEDDV